MVISFNGMEKKAKRSSKPLKWLSSKLHKHQVSTSEIGPASHELNDTEQQVASARRGNGQATVPEIPTAKSEPQSHFLLGKAKPPQIPSDPAADQSANKILLANGFNLASKNTAKGKALLWAIQNKQKNAARLVLNKGADIGVVDRSGETPLHKTAYVGDPEVLEWLLFRQVDLGARNSAGWTALHIAAAKGKGPFIRLLLGAGADSCATTPDQFSALCLALESKDEASIKALLESGVEVDSRNPAGWTALHSAASKGRASLVHALLEVGADPNATTAHGMSALDLALESKSEKSIEALLEHGAHVALCIHSDGVTIQQMMAKHGADTIVKLVMAQHVQKSAKGSPGATVLHVAAEAGHVPVVRLLLNSKVNVAMVDDLGRLPLHVAAQRGHQQVVELLLSRNADASATCNSKSIALHLSAGNGHLGTTKALLGSLQSYSRSDARDVDGRTPMYLAIANGHTDVVRLFIEIHGDHMIKDCEGRTAAYWAGEREYWKVLRLLQLHEGRLARESGSPKTPRRLGVRDAKNSDWSKYEKDNNMVDPMILRWD